MTDPATPFPEHWLADVLATDGGVVHLRPVVPEDAHALASFHEQLSDRTRYLRYFGPHPRMSERELHHATHVDHHDRVALLALLGDEIIAVGIYERLDGTRSAEVAFVVDDEQQGRGLGSILLEHLAGAAAENGIDTFVAEVLAENRGMVTVFRDAGYQIERSLDGSVLHLEFAIDPTEALLSVRDSRERATEARSVGNLLAPRSVAVIGASANPAKAGGAVFRNLLAAGFAGTVFPVNSAHHSVRGVRAYPSVREIPDGVDLAVVAVPATEVDQVLDDCLAKGVKGLVVVTAGFSETGQEGREAERVLMRQARGHGMRVVGPNALGIANRHPAVSLNATLASVMPPHGRIGFFCQSGPLGASILAEAASRRLGLATFVSAGNRADVSANDLLQYWDTDADTDVVLLYLESFGNPRKFSRIARRLARTKPIVAVSNARSAEPENDIDRTIARNLFAQSGIIQVDSIAELFDCAAVLGYQPLPAGPRLRIVSNSTMLAQLADDAARNEGLQVGVPVNLGHDADPETYRVAVTEAMIAPDCDAVLVIFAPLVIADNAEPFADAIGAAGKSRTKPLITAFEARSGIPPQLTVHGEHDEPVRGSIPSFPDPERAARALAHVRRYAAWRDRPRSPTTRPDGIDAEHAQALLAGWMSESPTGRWLSDADAVALMRCYGIDVVEFREVTGADAAVAAAAELGYPVALKATGEQWRVRADLSGVRLNVAGSDAVRVAYEELAELTGRSLVHVQRMAHGIGCVVRVRDDRAFGSVISFGLSGLVSDLLGDRAYRALPLSDGEATELIAAPRAAPLLSGYHNSENVDKAALAVLLQRVSTLCDDLPEVRALALEPVLASAAGTAVLYARVRIGPEPSRFDTGPRRLG